MFFGATLTAVSCSPDSTSPISAVTRNESPTVGRNTKSLIDQYDWTGKYHNDALAYALVRIKKSKATSKHDKCKVGLAALKEFQKEFRKANKRAGFDNLNLTDGMCEAAEANGFRVSPSVNISTSELRPGFDMSPAGTNYMNQITNAVDAMTSVFGLTASINSIGSSASASVTGLEAAAIGSAGSIALSSANYWTANESAWSSGPQTAYSLSVGNTANNAGIAPPAAPRYQISGRSKAIIRADAVAAVGVLLSEWFLGEVAVGHACIRAAAASLMAGLLY
jgi:hypothetical protein